MSATTMTGGGIGVRAAAGHLVTMARRNLLHTRSDPEQLVGMTVQPLMFLIVFVYVFGGAIAGSSREYLQFALPGFLVQAGAFTALQTGIGLSADFQRGLVDRFRSLPMARSAVIGGRILADGVRVAWGTAMILAVGMLLGFRFEGGAVEALAGLGLVVAFGMALCWPMAFLGVTLRSVESVQVAGFLTVLPLSFASSVFAPPESMPGWLQGFVEVNPITAVVDATRALMLGGEVADPLVRSVAWIVGIAVVCGALAVRRYRARS